jgi:D-cysteine desulfhydrase
VREGKRPYVIPEGRLQWARCVRVHPLHGRGRKPRALGLAGDGAFDIVFHACGSGGTTAGVALGAARHGVAKEVRAIAVCDDAPTFERVIHRIIDEAREIDPSLRLRLRA